MKSPLFTPRSARDTARALHSTLADALHLYRALRACAPPQGVEERPVDPGYFIAVRHLVRAVERVRAAGAEVDLAGQRVRFPARRAGRDVVLFCDLAEPHALWLGDAPAVDDGAWEEPG